MSICDSINEVYQQIILDINEKNVNLVEKVNQISIIIPVHHVRVKEICFDIPEIIKKDDKKMDDLISEVNGLKKVIKELDEHSNKKIKYVEKENAILKEKIIIMEKNYSNLANKYQSMEKAILKIIDKIKKNNNNNNNINNNNINNKTYNNINNNNSYNNQNNININNNNNNNNTNNNNNNTNNNQNNNDNQNKNDNQN